MDAASETSGWYTATNSGDSERPSAPASTYWLAIWSACTRTEMVTAEARS
jgi:hypothetical protein